MTAETSKGRQPDPTVMAHIRDLMINPVPEQQHTDALLKAFQALDEPDKILFVEYVAGFLRSLLKTIVQSQRTIRALQASNGIIAEDSTTLEMRILSKIRRFGPVPPHVHYDAKHCKVCEGSGSRDLA